MSAEKLCTKTVACAAWLAALLLTAGEAKRLTRSRWRCSRNLAFGMPAYLRLSIISSSKLKELKSSSFRPRRRPTD